MLQIFRELVMPDFYADLALTAEEMAIGYVVGAAAGVGIDWQIFTKVTLPSASSWMLTGLKMSLPFALVGVILGEFLVSSHGLGYRLNAYSTGYNTTGALAIVFLMMGLMMLLTGIVNRIEARLLRWRPRQAALDQGV